MKPNNLIEFTLVFHNEAVAAYNAGEWPKDADFPRFMAPSVISAVIEEIARHARTLETLNVKACNVGDTPGDDRRYEKAKAKITELFERYGIKPVFQGDPRGAALGILCTHTQRHNSWGGHESGFRLNFEGK